jgi:holo-[acyl-carrier protein] synthase
MIYGIGIDSVEIERFTHWHTYSTKRLLRVFSSDEITYCLANPLKSAERFAARFAAKEAFLKAISPLVCENNSLTLVTVCKYVTITHTPLGQPLLTIHWNRLGIQMKDEALLCHLSLTHTKTVATALVIIEK